MWVESKMVCCLPRFLNQLAHLPNLVWIKTDGRLIENEQIGLVQKRIGQTDPLAITFRKRADQFFLHLFQAAKFFHVADAFGNATMRHAFQRRAIIEILGHAHVVIERDVFRHVTEMGAGLERLLENIEAGDGGATGSRRHEAGQNSHRRGLAGAVRAEKAHDFAFADLEIQIFDRGMPGVAFGEIFDFNHFEIIPSDN